MKKLKPLSLICSSLLLTVSLHAQEYFDKKIDGHFSDALYDIVQDYDGQISAIGYSQHFKQTQIDGSTYHDPFEYLSNFSNRLGEQMRLVKLNDQAQVTLDKSLKLNRFNKAVSLIKTPDNGYFVGGYTQDGKLIILRLDSNGKTKFMKLFGTKNFDRMHKLVSLRDGGVLAVGSSTTSRSFSDDIFQGGLGLNDIFVTRFAKNGQKLWSKKYGTTLDDRGLDATEAYDGTLLVLSSADDKKNRQATLMRLSENGDKIWLRKYGKEGVLNPHSIITLYDNHFLVNSSYYSPMDGNKIQLVKFDLQRNILAEYSIKTQHPTLLHDIKEQVNGSFIAVGRSKTSMNTNAFAIKLNSKLHPIWRREFASDETQEFNAVQVLQNSQYAIVGESTAAQSENTDMWITKLNSDGSTALTAPSKSIYDALCDEFKDEIGKNILKVNQDLSIELSAPYLYFKTGEYDLNPDQTSFIDRFTPRLLKSIEQYSTKIKNIKINGHTSSEWGKQNFNNRYIKNLELSSQRAVCVSKALFNAAKSTEDKRNLTKWMSADAQSYRDIVFTKGKIEDRVKSRRVGFRIVLK